MSATPSQRLPRCCVRLPCQSAGMPTTPNTMAPAICAGRGSSSPSDCKADRGSNGGGGYGARPARAQDALRWAQGGSGLLFGGANGVAPVLVFEAARVGIECPHQFVDGASEGSGHLVAFAGHGDRLAPGGARFHAAALVVGARF